MTATPQVTTVVFDLGGVLIDWRRELLYDRLIPDAERRAWFLDTVCSLEWNADGDRGRPFAELVAERSARFPDEADLIAAYWERWDEMAGSAIDGTVEIMAELQERAVPTSALTNWSAETLPRVRHRYGFLESFEGMVVSGEEGVIKPDPAIYELLCRRFGIRSTETFFVDDSQTTDDAAAALGFVAHRFVDPCTLRAALAEAGLLTPARRSP